MIMDLLALQSSTCSMFTSLCLYIYIYIYEYFYCIGSVTLPYQYPELSDAYKNLNLYTYPYSIHGYIIYIQNERYRVITLIKLYIIYYIDIVYITK